MKHNKEKQHTNAAMTLSNEKNNRTTMKPTMKKKNEKTTIVQQSFNNEKTIKHTNETRQ